MIKLAENSYGKSRVRVIRVKRSSNSHELREWSVQVLLQGDFESCFTGGDNSKILPTDTMKNTVYSVARNSRSSCIEEFAKELVAFLLSRNPQVSAVESEISQIAWDPIHLTGHPHPTAFRQSSGELQTVTVVQKR